MSHIIDTSKINIRTDLAIEEVRDINIDYIEEKIKNDIKITSILIDDNNIDCFKKKKGKYITIEFNDVTDYDSSKQIEEIFIEEFKNLVHD